MNATMNAQRWARMKQLFGETVRLDAAASRSCLDRACASANQLLRGRA